MEHFNKYYFVSWHIMYVVMIYIYSKLIYHATSSNTLPSSDSIGLTLPGIEASLPSNPILPSTSDV